MRVTSISRWRKKTYGLDNDGIREKCSVLTVVTHTLSSMTAPDMTEIHVQSQEFSQSDKYKKKGESAGAFIENAGQFILPIMGMVLNVPYGITSSLIFGLINPISSGITIFIVILVTVFALIGIYISRHHGSSKIAHYTNMKKLNKRNEKVAKQNDKFQDKLLKAALEDDSSVSDFSY